MSFAPQKTRQDSHTPQSNKSAQIVSGVCSGPVRIERQEMSHLERIWQIAIVLTQAILGLRQNRKYTESL